MLHLSWEYPPHAVGGLGVHVAGLARAQAAAGAAVTVVTAAGGGASPRGPVRVVRAGLRPRPGAGPFLWQLERLGGLLTAAAKAAFPPAGPSLVHAHDWLVAGPALTLARRWGCPLVVTFHATEKGRRGAAAGRDGFGAAVLDGERRLHVAAAARIVCSAAMAHELAAAHGAAPLAVIPGGWEPEATPRGRRPTAGRILFAGRLVPEKGLAVLLRALAAVLPERPDLHLRVAGEGPAEGDLRRLSRVLGLEDRVAFLGRLGGAALARERLRAAVQVVPSLYEPFGLTALEAMACGLGVLASRTGGLEEWARPWARLLPPGDASVWSAALREPPPSAPPQRELSGLTWAEVARRVANLYRVVLAEGAWEEEGP